MEQENKNPSKLKIIVFALILIVIAVLLYPVVEEICYKIAVYILEKI